MRRISAGFCLLLVAMTGLSSPAAGESGRPVLLVPATPVDVVLVVDGSAGMKAVDPAGIWRAAVFALATALSPDDRLALVVAGRTGVLAAPFMAATDSGKLKGALRAVRSRGPHADLVAGLETAMTLFLEVGSERKRAVVLLTASQLLPDPDRLVGVPPGGDAAAFLREWLYKDLLPRMKAQGVEAYSVGIGGAADAELLKEIADGTALTLGRPHWFVADDALQLPAALLEIGMLLSKALAATVLSGDGTQETTTEFFVDPWLNAPRIVHVGNSRLTLHGPDGKKVTLQSPVPGIAVYVLPGYDPAAAPGTATVVAAAAEPADKAENAPTAAAKPADKAENAPTAAAEPADKAENAPTAAAEPANPGHLPPPVDKRGVGLWRATVAPGAGPAVVYLVGRSHLELQTGDFSEVIWEGEPHGVAVRAVAAPPVVSAELSSDISVEARVAETGEVIPLTGEGALFRLLHPADRTGTYTFELALAAIDKESGQRLQPRKLGPIRVEVLPRPLVTIEGLRRSYAEGETVRAEALVSILKAHRDEVLGPEVGWFVTDNGPGGDGKVQPQAVDGKYLFEFAAAAQGSHVLAVELRPRWAKDGRLLPPVKVGEFKFQVGPPPLPPLPELTVRLEGLKNKYEYGESITANLVPIISGKPAVSLLGKARVEALLSGQGEDLTVPLLQTPERFELRLVASGSGPMRLRFRLNASEKGTGREFQEISAGPFEFQVPELPSVSMRVDGLRTEYELGSLVVAALFPSVSRRGYELSEHTAVSAVLVWSAGEASVPMERDGAVFGLRFEPPVAGDYTLQFVIHGRDKARNVLLPQDSSTQKAYRFAVFAPEETAWVQFKRITAPFGGWPVLAGAGIIVLLAFVGLGTWLVRRKKKAPG